MHPMTMAWFQVIIINNGSLITVKKLEAYKKVCMATMFFLYNLQVSYPNKGILQRYNFMNLN
jgi:hypothetical protein